MHSRNVFLLFFIFFTALMLTDLHKVTHAVLDPVKVVNPLPKAILINAQDPGIRCTRLPDNQRPKKCSKRNSPPALVSFKASKSLVYLIPECPAQSEGVCQDSNPAVELIVDVKDPDGDTILYTYSTTGGRITGEGAKATWDLSGVPPGTYTATVEFDDGCGCMGFTSLTVTVDRCSCESVPVGADTLIIGVVKDTDGSPISGASVRADKQGSDFSSSDVTNAAGKYVLRPLEVGRYRVVASKTNYHEQMKDVRLADPGDRLELNFQLQKK